MNAVLLFESVFKIVLKFNRLLESLFWWGLVPHFYNTIRKRMSSCHEIGKGTLFFSRLKTLSFTTVYSNLHNFRSGAAIRTFDNQS